MIIPGIVSATFKKLDCYSLISLTKKNGLKAIEWSENHHIKIGDPSFASKIARETRLAGLEVASYGSYYKLNKNMDFIPSLENCLAMDAKIIRIWAGDKPSREVGQEAYEDSIKEAKAISQIASKYGVSVCLEWHRNTLTDRNSSGLKFIKDVNEANFKTFWQPSPEMNVAERCTGLKDLKDYIKNLHVYYWDETGRKPLYEGKEDWKKYLSILGDTDHYALLEFVKDDSIQQFERDAAEFISWF